MNGTQPAGWYRDPTGRYSMRYWDGQQWSNQANSGGTNITDEVPAEMRTVPPPPGTEVKAAAMPAATAQPSVQVTQQAPRSSFGAIVALILVIVVMIALAAALISRGGGDSADTTEVPVTIEAPATTDAPAPTEAPATTVAPATE